MWLGVYQIAGRACAGRRCERAHARLRATQRGRRPATATLRSRMSWLLASAVLIVLVWIVRIAVTPIFDGDRRRRLAAEADALQAEALRLDAERPGSSPERAIEVTSASQIEPRAERGPCPACGGNFHVLAHTVRTVGTDRLRHVTCRCGGCGLERATWFRVGPTDVTPGDPSASPC